MIQSSLYVVCHENEKLPIKIGITYNIKHRMIGIQNGNPLKIVLFKEFICNGRCLAIEAEKEFHRQMKDKRIRGEWFDMPPNEAVKIIPNIIRECSEKLVSGLDNKVFKKDYRKNIVDKEKECLDFIINFYKNNGFIPHVEEISSGIKTVKSMIVRLIFSLHKKGYIDIKKDGRGNIIGVTLISS